MTSHLPPGLQPQAVPNQPGRFQPTGPAPDTGEKCEGTLKIECCCCKLMTHTIWVEFPPATAAAQATNALATVNFYEANGWLILGHSLAEDIGNKKGLLITVGWYV